MSRISDNGIIHIDRGDSFAFDYVINLGSKIYPHYYKLSADDRLYFAVMQPNAAFEEAIILKTYTMLEQITADDKSYVAINFKPGDTQNLEAGRYYYTVKLVRVLNEEENVKTLVSGKLFYIEGTLPKPEIPDAPEPDDDVIYDGGDVTDEELEDIEVIYDGGEIV